MNINKMTLGPVMCDLRGLQLEADEHDMLLHPHVGGCDLVHKKF